MFAARRLIIRPFKPCLQCLYSTSAPAPPPLLLQIRNDMKVAMKAKDSARLDVLRGLISEVTNAAKTSKPVNTDSHMVNIIRKRMKSSEAAAEEFQNAQRDDLKAREVAQLAVLGEYVVASSSLGEGDIKIAIREVVGKMRTQEKDVNRGSVMKALIGPGGNLEDQMVDKSEVSKLVAGMV